MGGTRPAVTKIRATVQLVIGDDILLPVRTCILFNPSDPYAIKLSFEPVPEGSQPMQWFLGRDLLNAGLTSESGEGDAKVWPMGGAHGIFIGLSLSGKNEETGQKLTATFRVGRTNLTRILRRAYALVPRGKECDWLDVDACIRQLLAPQP